eukprot:2615780-Pyramimonas_sp.AAC.1
MGPLWRPTTRHAAESPSSAQERPGTGGSRPMSTLQTHLSGLREPWGTPCCVKSTTADWDILRT